MSGEFIFLAVGVGSLIMGTYRFIKSRNAESNWISVPGIIVKLSAQAKSMYLPTVQYTTTEGETLTKLCDVYVSKLHYQEGHEIEILYDPQDPNNFMMKVPTVKSPGFVMLLIGIIFIGCYFYYTSSKSHHGY